MLGKSSQSWSNINTNKLEDYSTRKEFFFPSPPPPPPSTEMSVFSEICGFQVDFHIEQHNFKFSLQTPNPSPSFPTHVSEAFGPEIHQKS